METPQKSDRLDSALFREINETEKWAYVLQSFAPRFGIYENGCFTERDLPFDPTPRIITASEFDFLKNGLIQRVNALNMFLTDIYGECRILKDGILPQSFVFSSQGFLPRCVGIKPRGGVYAHIAGIDLVKSKNGEWYVLEDNLRVPSGVSYPLTARRALRDLDLECEAEDSWQYKMLLSDMFEYVSAPGISAVLTPGRGNCAYFEHGYLAEITGSALCTGNDLFVDNDVLYFKGADGVQRVGVLYSRIDGLFADPLAFRSVSTVGVPNLFSAYATGNTAVVNAFGCGVADDKGIYCFVPQIIKYYLGEKPLLSQPETYLPSFSKDMRHIMTDFDDLVIKDVTESGGYGVIFVSSLTQTQKEELKAEIISCPRRFIAQEIIDFEELPTRFGMRKADLRAFVISGEKTEVWNSGLTRFAAKDTFVVNSSQGGGFKDTWVLSR